MNAFDGSYSGAFTAADFLTPESNKARLAAELDWAVYVAAPRGWRRIAAFQSVEQARAYARARAKQTGRAYIWDRNTEAT